VIALPAAEVELVPTPNAKTLETSRRTRSAKRKSDEESLSAVESNVKPIMLRTPVVRIAGRKSGES
jgi:DNA integrity scanning protein DisA with diadenylate cyclase activity